MKEAERAARALAVCRRKRSFRSAEWALAYARAQYDAAVKRGDELTSYHVQPYRCPACKLWHLTRRWQSFAEDQSSELHLEDLED